jgi:hypothetical protein
VVGRQHFNGVVQGYARLPHGLALLVTPANAIGRARLVVSDADAGLRAVTLAEINAGFKQFDDTDGSGPRMEQAVPGIAADPAGRRVYVVPGGGPVAEVEVASLQVTYHRLGRSASPLQRLARWWAPPAEAKIISGPSRNALWLGDGQLAVTGYDGSAKGHHMEIPSGLELIDTRTWTVRQVDRHSSSAMLAAGRLLAFGTAFGTGQGATNQGYGLTVDPGQRRSRLCPADGCQPQQPGRLRRGRPALGPPPGQGHRERSRAAGPRPDVAAAGGADIAPARRRLQPGGERRSISHGSGHQSRIPSPLTLANDLGNGTAAQR